jgi:hypothetical protein
MTNLTLITNAEISTFLGDMGPGIDVPVGSQSGPSVMFSNWSPITFDIMAAGMTLEKLAPYSYLMMNNVGNMRLVAKSSSLISDLTLTDYAVYATFHETKQPFMQGSLQFPGPVSVVGTMVATIDQSSGPLNVTGPVTATIDQSSGPLDITGPVTIPNGVDVSNFPATFNVTTASGDTVTIAGTINIASNQTVGISGVATVEFNGTQDVNLSASDITLDTNIANVKLATNALVPLTLAATTTVANLASGTAVSLNLGPYIPAGYFDAMIVMFHSSGGYVYSQASLALNYVETATNTYITQQGVINLDTTASMGTGLQKVAWDFPAPSIGNGCYVALINNTGTTIASDTITVDVYLVKSTINVGNSSSSPANVLQPATAYNPVTNGSIATGGTSQVMVGSNANRKFLQIWNTSSTDILWVQMGQASGVNSGFPIGPGFMFQFPNPQPSNDIYIYGATTGDTYAYSEG